MAIRQTAELIWHNFVEGWLLPLHVDQTRDQHKQLEGQTRDQHKQLENQTRDQHKQLEGQYPELFI